jgi:DNA-binding IclR family transcriptional regulator
LTPVTRRTPTNLKQLRAQLDADRSVGLAWSDGNYEAGISSLAAVVFDASGAPVAALNATGQTANFGGAGRRDEIARAVRAASQEISERLGWRAAPPHRAPAGMIEANRAPKGAPL